MSNPTTDESSYKKYLETNKLSDTFANHLAYLKFSRELDSTEIEKQKEYCTRVVSDDGSCACFLAQVSELKAVASEKDNLAAFNANINKINSDNAKEKKEYEDKRNTLLDLNTKFLKNFKEIINYRGTLNRTTGTTDRDSIYKDIRTGDKQYTYSNILQSVENCIKGIQGSDTNINGEGIEFEPPCVRLAPSYTYKYNLNGIKNEMDKYRKGITGPTEIMNFIKKLSVFEDNYRNLLKELGNFRGNIVRTGAANTGYIYTDKISKKTYNADDFTAALNACMRGSTKPPNNTVAAEIDLMPETCKNENTEYTYKYSSQFIKGRLEKFIEEEYPKIVKEFMPVELIPKPLPAYVSPPARPAIKCCDTSITLNGNETQSNIINQLMNSCKKSEKTPPNVEKEAVMYQPKDEKEDVLVKIAKFISSSSDTTKKIFAGILIALVSSVPFLICVLAYLAFNRS